MTDPGINVSTLVFEAVLLGAGTHLIVRGVRKGLRRLFIAIAMVIALGAWALHVVKRQTAAIGKAYESIANESDGPWDRLSPAARSWLISQPWHGRSLCDVTNIDIDTADVSARCGVSQVNFGFRFECEGLLRVLRYARLVSCDRTPRLRRIVVKHPSSEWKTVFISGEPIEK